MPKKDLELDLTPLMKVASKASNKISLKEALASNRFAQVGLNMFRDQTTNCFWRLEHGDDGQEYIVRGDPENTTVVESESDWAAIPDSNKESITLSYHKMPICKFAASEFGLTNDSIEDFQKYLLERVKEPAFVRSLYAYVTGQCPGCGSKPSHVGLTEVVCSTPGCEINKRATHQYKTRIEDKVVLPEFGGGVTSSEGIAVYDLSTDKHIGTISREKAYELEDKGLISIEKVGPHAGQRAWRHLK